MMVVEPERRRFQGEDGGMPAYRQRNARLALAAVLIGPGAWTIHDFLPALAWAAILAIAFWPLCETAKLNDIDPPAWLTDVLARLPDHPARRLVELLPWNWKASRAPTILAQAA